jgi:NTE family protein
MALPGIFTPVQIDGRTYVDGGVTRNLPAQDARDMGADFVIAVDLSMLLASDGACKTIAEVMSCTIRANRGPLHKAQRELSDVLIEPKVDDFGVLDFHDVKELIRRGEMAARGMLDSLQLKIDALYASRGLSRPRPSASDATITSVPTTLYIADVQVRGLKSVSESVALGAMRSSYPDSTTIPELGREIDRVHATMLFERVDYRVTPTDSGNRLVLTVREKARKTISVGFRYDTYSRLSTVINVSLRSKKRLQPSFSVGFELGNHIGVDAEYLALDGRRTGVRAKARFTRVKTRRFREPGLPGEMWSNTGLLAVALTRDVYNKAQFSVGLEGLYQHVTPSINLSGVSAVSDAKGRVVAQFWYDNFDRSSFAWRGHNVWYRLSHESIRKRGAGRGLEQRFDWRGKIPVTRRTSLLTEVQFVSATSFDRSSATNGRQDHPDAAVLAVGASLGGDNTPLLQTGRFVGLAPFELTGKHMKAAMLGYQFEPRSGYVAMFRANVGNTFDKWISALARGPYLVGAGLTVGRTTPVGPVSITLSSSTRHNLLVGIAIGHTI